MHAVKALGRALIADLIILLGRQRGRHGQSGWSWKSPGPRTLSSITLGFLQLFAVFLGLAAAISALGVAWAISSLPDVAKPIGETAKPSFLLEAANGELLGRVGLLKVSSSDEDDLSTWAVTAIISAEDRRFYNHFGFDPLGIVRALQRNLVAGSVVEGGSTITQQLVKVRFFGPADSLPDKLREVLAATWLDLKLSKEEILRRYLNSIYMGNGAYGLPAAARFYFDKNVSELTLSEGALLAGLIKCPSRCNPVRDFELARARAETVIDRMQSNGFIGKDVAAKAKRRPAVLQLSRETVRAGSWYADWVYREASELSKDPYADTVRVRTTLIPELQSLAEQVISEALTGPAADRKATQAALVAMRPDGAVVAMVGGRDYRKSQFNRAADARRQPGSAFKLFVYFAALRAGYTPSDTIDASAVSLGNWEPENSSGRRYEHVTLGEAFSLSINTAAVRLTEEVGLNEVISAARDLGIDAPLPALPSLALGTAEVTLLDLTGSFASVRAGKLAIEPWGIAGLDGTSQKRTHSQPISAKQSLGQHQKPLIELLEAVVQRGTGRAAALAGFAAGKTGTSQDYRDAWFIGFNESLVAGVWFGNDDGTPMARVTGGSLPAATWKNFMSKAASHVAAPSKAVDTLDKAILADQEEGIACDYRACSRAYNSFRAADCTFKPYAGPRKICEKRGF